MKKMTIIEMMDGFLKGKCIPSDLKVNETNAEYLVRKFAELESKLETALRECRSAGITIDNLDAKCAALAADNSALNKFIKDDCWIWDDKSEEYFDAADCIPETPATDAFLAEVRSVAFDELRAAFVRHAKVAGLDDADTVTLKEVTEALLHCAEQLREGVNQ